MMILLQAEKESTLYVCLGEAIDQREARVEIQGGPLRCDQRKPSIGNRDSQRGSS